MSFSLSIIVPTLNEADHIESFLLGLTELRQEGAEIILADGGSCDGTPELVNISTKILHAPRGRARQMNAGAAAARGEWLLFLHADTRLPPAVEVVLKAAMDNARVDWGFFPVRLTGGASLLRWVERGINWRSRWSQIATGDQAILVRKSSFEALGGFADIPLMEDIEFCKRIKRQQGVRPVIFEQPVTTSSRRWEDKGILRTIISMWALRAAYACGASPEWLVKFYYPASADS
jgi:rSAM/selenodomain-associated transferase 2